MKQLVGCSGIARPKLMVGPDYRGTKELGPCCTRLRVTEATTVTEGNSAV